MSGCDVGVTVQLSGEVRHESQSIGSSNLRELQDRPAQGNCARDLHQHQAQAKAGVAVASCPWFVAGENRRNSLATHD
jgi:hypothetical protein